MNGMKKCLLLVIASVASLPLMAQQKAAAIPFPFLDPCGPMGIQSADATRDFYISVAKNGDETAKATAKAITTLCGYGRPKDEAKGIRALRAAALDDPRTALGSLVSMNAFGLYGLRQNPSKAYALLLLQACNFGPHDDIGPLLIIEMQALIPKTTDQDRSNARLSLPFVCRRIDHLSRVVEGMWLHDHSPYALPENASDVQRLESEAKAGKVNAQIALALAYSEGHVVPEDKCHAAKLFKTAGEKGRKGLTYLTDHGLNLHQCDTTDVLTAAALRDNFQPQGNPIQIPLDIPGTSLTVEKAVCKNIPDHCEKLFIAVGDRFIGTDTVSPSWGIKSVQLWGPGTFHVLYSSGVLDTSWVTVVYKWDGAHLVASGTPPTRAQNVVR